MKNKNETIIYFIVAVIAEIFYYFIFNDYIIGAVLSILTSVVFTKFVYASLKEVKNKVEKIQFAHQFINSLIIQLSVNPSLYDSIQQIKEYLPEKYKQLFSNPEENHFVTLNSLAYLLDISIFNVFVKIMNLYENQGGDPLLMNYNLINDLDNLKVKTDSFVKSKKRKLRDFNLMWAMIGLILLYIRFFLKDYYIVTLTSIFKIILIISVIIFLGSQFLFSKKYKNINLEGGSKI